VKSRKKAIYQEKPSEKGKGKGENVLTKTGDSTKYKSLSAVKKKKKIGRKAGEQRASRTLQFPKSKIRDKKDRERRKERDRL